MLHSYAYEWDGNFKRLLNMHINIHDIKVRLSYITYFEFEKGYAKNLFLTNLIPFLDHRHQYFMLSRLIVSKNLPTSRI